MKASCRVPDNLHVFLGKHPELGDPEDTDEIIELVRRNRLLIAGIGEVGIPYFNLKHFTPSEREKVRQRETGILQRFLAIAGELGLPVNMHVVKDDVYPCLELLRQHRPPSALFHWFVGDDKAIRAIIASPVPVFVSVNVDLLADPDYAAYASTLPPELLLAETDAPYFYHDSCASAIPDDVCSALARLRGVSRDELAATLAGNLKSFLCLPRNEDSRGRHAPHHSLRSSSGL